MGDDIWKAKPEAGDIIKTEPTRVTSGDELLGDNPTSWGHNHVKIQKTNLDTVLPQDVIKSIKKHNGPFRIGNESNEWPAEIVRVGSGRYTVKLLDADEVQQDDEKEDIISSPNRKEPIEWQGTPQEVDSQQADKRSNTFHQDDPRGSKNDLLDGHL